MAKTYIRKYGCSGNAWHELKKGRKTITKCGDKITADEGHTLSETEFRQFARNKCRACGID